MKPRDLPTLSVGDTLDLDDFTMPLAATSPLSLLSPNTGGPKVASPAKGGCGRAAAPAAAAAAPLPPLPDDEEEENEPLGALPQLGGRSRRGGSRRPDPRRQSLAISQLFAGLSAGAGLLGDSELAVGDEDIQVPLARSGKLLGGAANHSSLFCDPDTEELLENELPSPHITAGAAAGREAAAAEVCESPVLLSSVHPGARSSRRTPAMWASTAVFGDLHRACEGQGLDDYDGGDFQMSDSNKVKELAFLFKMESAAATPRSSVDASALRATTSSLRASRDGGSVLRASRDGGSLLRGEGGSAASPPASQQQQAAGGKAQPAEQPKDAQQAVAGTVEPQASAAASPPPQQQRQEPAAPAAAPPAAAAPSARPAAAKPAASRLPAPPARASRLRPPTSSSGFFSNAATAATGSRPVARSAAAAGSAGPARPASSASTRGKATASTGRPGSAGSHAAGAAGTPSRVGAKAGAGGAASAVPSRLASGSSRIPTPGKPAARPEEAVQRPHAGGMFGQRTLSSAVARQRPAGAAAAVTQQQQQQAGQSRAAATRGSQAGTSRVPPLKAAPSPAAAAPSPANSGAASASAGLTPNTARLRWLEQNPELAFGGGNKLAASPAVQEAEQPAKKLTAEERHLMEWADHL